MGVARTGEQATQAAVLPLTVQNAYRARYRAIRPGWLPSGEMLETMVRGAVSAQSTVLDLGCGRGGVVELIWPDVALAAGLDPDSASLAEHRAAGMPVLQATGEHLPFAGGSFDVVVSVWVMEHLREPAKVLAEVRRVLRPGGRFMFLTPNLRHPLMMLNRVGKAAPVLQRRLVPWVYGRDEADTFPVQYRANTVRALRRLAREVGLEVESLTVVADPTYLALSPRLFRASVLSERLMPRGWGIHLVGSFVRPAV